LGIHPIHGTQRIEQSYREYLLTSFHMNKKKLMEQFEQLLSQKNKFLKGPYLEMTNPYKEGVSIQDLINEDVLSIQMGTLNQNDMPKGRPLYVHQEQAIRKAVNGRNFVVATGTGSGKTESFLLPVINHLFREKEQNKLTPGVRALLVYPMNALANDQLKRLRTLLADTPEITFGRFTGETKNRKEEARSYYKNSHDGQEPLPNELLSREEMRDNPPHILITNYAMLEYLLLRPGDTNFFDGPTSLNWKYIILDEAHTYNGAKGIEVGMLLRRLKDRVLKNKPTRGSIQCIATSATLGSGPNAKTKVMNFAESLFDEPFIWNNEVQEEQDLIEAIRIDYDDHFEYWGAPDWNSYTYLKEVVGEDTVKLDKDRLLSYGFSDYLVNHVTGKNLPPQQVLYELISGTSHLQRLRQSLKEKPRLLREIVHEVVEVDFIERSTYLDPEIAEELLTNFVELAVRAKRHESDLPLLPARYHVFVRAIEGAYVQFLPKPQLHLDAKKEVKDGTFTYPLFETGVCNQCGQIHIIGEERNGKLYQKSSNNPDPELKFTAYMVIDHKDFTPIIDEDEEVFAGDVIETDQHVYQICPSCTSINPSGGKIPCCCEQHGKVNPIYVIKEEIRRNQRAICHNCGKRSGNPIKLFTTGQDAPTSVLVTSLYQELIKSNPNVIEELDSSFDLIDDPFGALDITNSSQIDKQIYEPQKLLVFSDSRQDAAFFAPYLERTHTTIMWKRLLFKTLTNLSGNELSLDDLIYKMRELAEEAKLFDGNQTKQSKETMVQTHLLRELLQIEKRISLQGTGLLSFYIPIPERFQSQLNTIAQKFGVETSEIWTIFEVLFDSFRIQNALSYPELVDPQNPLFYPRNRRSYMNGHQSVATHHVHAWIPSEKRTNRRLDYLTRVYLKKGFTQDEATEKARHMLDMIWTGLISKQRLPELFERTNVSGAGTVFTMKYDAWRIPNDRVDWYKCSNCGNWTVRNVENICPELKCEGVLQKGNPLDGHNHYRNLYTDLIPMKMTTKEHTAQLSNDQATLYQQDFIDNKINVLSCSTTFEMGVDVGGLESVFMRNVPPETANYIQRAGRAGRRKSTVAYSLTYAQRRSHDLSYFKNPESIIAGTISPPVFKIDNIKIIRRHIHSVALSAFFRENPSYYGKGGKIEEFLRSSSSKEIQGVYAINEFLEKKPLQILQSLERIVPSSLHNMLGISSWKWVEELCGENGILTKSEGLYLQDIDELKQLRERRFKEQKSTDSIQRMIRTIMDRELIQFLSSHNVLPKYGFPVDVVSLQLQDKNSPISLDRDLAIAISEYAPGAEIIADGNIYRSIGVKRLPKYELPSVQYLHCNCGHFQTVARHQKSKTNEIIICESCMNEVTIQSFISPIFGFTSEKGDKPGEFRPAKAYRSRVFFSEYQLAEQDVSRESEGNLMLGDLYLNWKYSPFGKLAVVNEGKGRGYFICQSCGVEKDYSGAKGRQHNTPWGGKCSGNFERSLLGHEFMTDVFELKIEGVSKDYIEEEGFWHSLLYGFLDSISTVLGVDRNDIDGCIYYKDRSHPSLIIFDNVPGGAGYTKEVPIQLDKILHTISERLKECSCGPETSCYGCLKNYKNQFAHDVLKRGLVIKALEKALKLVEI
jgi:ATP-dependent helicase YprA (DUF1998 family)